MQMATCGSVVSPFGSKGINGIRNAHNSIQSGVQYSTMNGSLQMRLALESPIHVYMIYDLLEYKERQLHTSTAL